jgi:hypothetical protein
MRSQIKRHGIGGGRIRGTAVPAVNDGPTPAKWVTVDGRQSIAAFAVGSGLNELRAGITHVGAGFAHVGAGFGELRHAEYAAKVAVSDEFPDKASVRGVNVCHMDE